MFVLLYFILIACAPLFAMEWTGDVLLKNVYNNNGKIINIDIVRDDKILTHAEFAPEKNLAQSWVTRLQSQKTGKPHSISIKQLGFTHTPTGAIKEFDLIIDAHGVSVVPSGTKEEEELAESEETRAATVAGVALQSSIEYTSFISLIFCSMTFSSCNSNTEVLALHLSK